MCKNPYTSDNTENRRNVHVCGLGVKNVLYGFRLASTAFAEINRVRHRQYCRPCIVVTVQSTCICRKYRFFARRSGVIMCQFRFDSFVFKFFTEARGVYIVFHAVYRRRLKLKSIFIQLKVFNANRSFFFNRRHNFYYALVHPLRVSVERSDREIRT